MAPRLQPGDRGAKPHPRPSPGNGAWTRSSQPHKGVPTASSGFCHLPPCPRARHTSMHTTLSFSHWQGEKGTTAGPVTSGCANARQDNSTLYKTLHSLQSTLWFGAKNALPSRLHWAVPKASSFSQSVLPPCQGGHEGSVLGAQRVSHTHSSFLSKTATFLPNS